MSAQTNWRWCHKCQGLFFSGGSSQGACPGGGSHDASRSGRYSALFGDGIPGCQDGWRWCQKCQGMFFSQNQPRGKCPADRNPHDGSGSPRYAIQLGDAVVGTQGLWRWCHKCQGLFFSGNTGPCPAGDLHDGSHSGQYGVLWEGMSNFNPMQHGFKFVNSFTNDVIPALDVRTSGLCGGMSYSALDYYFSNKPIPSQPFRPANRTALQSYLYNRQVTSITGNLDKWAEIGLNPFGARDTEFFNWGISAKKGERIDELKQFLDKGTPCVIGLQGDGSTGNHQVIAIGYTMGRYRGDLGAHVEDFKIYVCDPNYPNEKRTLIPDVGRKIYCYEEGGSQTWRTYFVDRKYQAHTPPDIPNANYPNDNLIYELVLQFFTGGDDLRGGNDNVDLVVNLTDGTQQTYRNINLGARWIVNNDESAEVILQRPIRQEELRSLMISATVRGGIGGDNWDMSQLVVWALGGGSFREIKSVGFKRFTGEDKTLIVPLNDVPTLPGQINKLIFTFQTGGDDLRGVNDNLNLTIHFRDGRTQRIENANGGRRWPDNTTNQVTVDLNRAVAPADIVKIDLDTTFGGGIGGDNWNMNSVSVRVTGNGVDRALVTHGFKRFTGSDKFLAIPVVVPSPAQANRLQLTIRTGGDDLRGGNDNLNVSLRYRDGRTQSVPNVNGGSRWADNTTNVVNINLDRAVLPNDVVEVTLQTTFGGGMGGDNWNMNSIQVAAIGDSVNQVVFNHGAKRFTGSDKTLTLSRP